MKLARRSSSSLLLLVLTACSVDDRPLTTGGGGSGSESPADRGGSGDEKPSGNGGAPADGGEPGAGLVEGCADLDTDGVPDCTTTLVDTPTFTEDVSGWVAFEGTTLAWDAKNALGDSPSGSAKLTTTSRRAGAAQCLPLSGKRLVIAYAQALSEGAANGDTAPRALLEVSYYGTKDCEGDALNSFETPPSTDDGAWTTVQAGGLSDENTRSLSIALIGLGAEGDTGLVVYFDNVMLKTQELD